MLLIEVEFNFTLEISESTFEYWEYPTKETVKYSKKLIQKIFLVIDIYIYLITKETILHKKEMNGVS